MSGFTQGYETIIVAHARAISFSLGILATALLLGLIAHSALFSAIGYIGRRRNSILYTSLSIHMRNASLLFMQLFAMNIAIPIIETIAEKTFSDSGRQFDMARSVTASLLIISVSWLLIRFTSVLENIMYSRFNISRDNPKTKSIITQFQLLKRIIIFTILVFTVGTVLMNFKSIQKLGATILASAGIAGIIVGMAAQRSVANLLAGIQIAITQPIRIGDKVVVENEFGTVDEITLTYVVVKLWDNRRLILPIMYFLEKPFHNWTLEPTNLLGTVLFYVDHTIPVEEVRVEFTKLLAASPKWDGAVSGLHVTNITGNSVELRALMSALPDDLWDLRCEIREKLLEFIRTRYPESLPKVRAEIRDMGGGAFSRSQAISLETKGDSIT